MGMEKVLKQYCKDFVQCKTCKSYERFRCHHQQALSHPKRRRCPKVALVSASQLTPASPLRHHSTLPPAHELKMNTIWPESWPWIVSHLCSTTIMQRRNYTRIILL